MALLQGRSRRDLLLAVGMVLGVNLVGAAPAFLFGAETDWIERPWFYPPEIAFPVVWTLLFTLLGISLFLVWRQGLDRRPVRVAFAAFGVQLFLNLLWTPVFFGLQRPGLGLAVILALWVAIVGMIAAFDRVDRRAAALQIPYLLWVSFASVLNYAIYTG
ncbi:TspO/MBR family protein [Natronomonas amylolytica]|uniref:TspO/MBR family protein n=1 Tax=Natronomonas amylolytica TaxID=3108498 RepID=UPI0030098AF4